ncbi:Asp/Glu racemase [Rhodovulum sp. 12E13]|uniref:aspartate/glutamate racemase family protein n=1 Tax=Rhodovulum sp. 12E13 TaxID=2203891 RepID=UPI000E1878F4|nr:aspartate/glutamate racemase family protein [Rhodovulum sp. 12E13]RDC74758.1 Asp/Glu racemase [Rhodovulum sp. 12E13]
MTFDRALVVINPNSSEHVTDGIAEAIAPLTGRGTPIRCVTLHDGPPGIESQAQADATVPHLLSLAADLEAEAAGFVIACFSDPGLHALRGRTALPVTGIGEAACLTALSLGDRFGVISILPASIPRHRRALRAMGIEGRCAGDRAIGLGVGDLAAADARDRMEETALALRDDDGADVLILGCAGMAHARAWLEEATGLPVIDPCQAGAAMALSQIALGLTHAQEPAHAR